VGETEKPAAVGADREKWQFIAKRGDRKPIEVVREKVWAEYNYDQIIILLPTCIPGMSAASSGARVPDLRRGTLCQPEMRH
jgi:hypothetical protein